MNDKIILGDILNLINELKYNESISIEDIITKLQWEENDIMKVLVLATRFYLICVDSRNSYDAKLEKHNRITGLDRDGVIALDLLNNPQLMQQVTSGFSSLEQCSIFTIIFLLRRNFQ